MRTTVFVLVLLLLWTSGAGAEAQDEAKSVKEINLRFQVLLYRLYELSNMNQPPGLNTTSGEWRDKVVSDAELEGPYKFPTRGLTGDTAKLAQAFGVFYSGTYKAFTENPNVDASWAEKGSSYRSALTRAGEKIYGISFNIYRLAGGD